MIQHNNTVNQTQQPIIKNGNYVMNYISSTTFGFVNTEDEARMINFNRGYIRGYFFDMNRSVFYYKEIDNLGQVIKFETYEYNQVIPPEPEKPVTHDDLANMQNNILSQIASMLQQNNIKEHMMQDLKAMMADADTERERKRIKEFIEDLQEMK